MAADPLLIDQLVEAIHDLIWIVSIDPSPSDRDKANAKILGMQLIVPTIPDPRKSESLRSAIDVALIAVVKSLRKAHPQIDWLPEDKQGQPDYASSIRKTFEEKVQKDIQPLSPYKKEDVRSIHAYIAFWEHFICGKPLTSLPPSFKHDDAVLKKYIELSGRELSKEEEQGQLWLKAHRSDQQWGRYHRLGKGLIFRYQLPPSEAAEPVTKLELLEQIVSSPQPPVASALVVTPHAQDIGMGSVYDRAERAVASLPTADEQYLMAEVLYRMPYLMATPRGFEAMISAIRGSRRLTRAHVIHTVVAFGRADGVDYSTLPESRACYEGHRVLSALLQNDFDTFLRTTDQDVLSYAGELLVTQPAYRSLCRPFVESSLERLNEWPLLMHSNSLHPLLVRYVSMFNTVVGIMAEHVWLEPLRTRLFGLIRDYVDTRVKQWVISVVGDVRQPARQFGWLMRQYGGHEGYKALCANFPKPMIYKQRDMWLALFGGYATTLPPTHIWQKLRLTTLTKKLDHLAIATLVDIAAEGEDAEAIAELKQLFTREADRQTQILRLLLEQGTPTAFDLLLDMLAVTTKISDVAAQTLTATFEPTADCFALPMLSAWAVAKLEKQGQMLSANQRGFLFGLCQHSDTKKARGLVARSPSSR